MDGTLLTRPILPFIRESDFAVRAPWRSAWRRLLDYLLIYIAEGHLVVVADSVRTDFYQGDFCLIQPNQLNRLEGATHTITPYAHLDIFFNARREESFPTKNGQVDLSPFSHLLQPRLNDIAGVHVPVRVKPLSPVSFRETLLSMVGAWQYRDVISQLKAQALATELVLALLQAYLDPDVAVAARPESLNWITSYLSFHLAEPLSVADMARRAHLSPSRFAAVFRQQFGASPHDYLLRLRIDHARELLERTDTPIHQIADYCGFADIHHFSKAFKKIVGIPPGSYRKDIAGSN